MSHLHAFLLCALLGLAGGAGYDVLTGLVYPVRNKWLTALAEAVFCLLFAGLYLLFSVKFALPAFRIYHFLGCAAGFFLYLKSLHKTVAFLAGKIYNGIVRKLAVRKSQKKRTDHTCRKRARVSPRRKQSASR